MSLRKLKTIVGQLRLDIQVSKNRSGDLEECSVFPKTLCLETPERLYNRWTVSLYRLEFGK